MGEVKNTKAQLNSFIKDALQKQLVHHEKVLENNKKL